MFGICVLRFCEDFPARPARGLGPGREWARRAAFARPRRLGPGGCSGSGWGSVPHLTGSIKNMTCKAQVIFNFLRRR